MGKPGSSFAMQKMCVKKYKRMLDELVISNYNTG